MPLKWVRMEVQPRTSRPAFENLPQVAQAISAMTNLTGQRQIYCLNPAQGQRESLTGADPSRVFQVPLGV